MAEGSATDPIHDCMYTLNIFLKVCIEKTVGITMTAIMITNFNAWRQIIDSRMTFE